MKQHEPLYKKLTAAQQFDLASITKHPGMDVLLRILGKGHVDIQMLQIMEVDVDDPERLTKLAAISGTAYSMKLFLALLETEIGYNFKLIQDREAQNQVEAELNATRIRNAGNRR